MHMLLSKYCTHLMDAMPITMEQQFSGYARQIELGINRIDAALVRLKELPQGGTAVEVLVSILIMNLVINLPKKFLNLRMNIL